MSRKEAQTTRRCLMEVGWEGVQMRDRGWERGPYWVFLF